MLKSGIIVIDKPEGMSSHGVVSRCRRILGMKRVGHGGTLDPMATGVLPVFFGRATRASDMSLKSDKKYIAGFRLGIRTDTLDITGSVTEKREVTVSESEVIACAASFTGRQKQLPPMYSAIKVEGKKLYELAREGKEAPRKPRDIEIYSISYLGRREKDYFIEVFCSKGTYIRTLVDDIGSTLGCGAVLTSLRRTQAGAFLVENAVTLERLEAAVNSGETEGVMRSVDTLFDEYPRVDVDADGERLCRVGAEVPFHNADKGMSYRVYAPGGEFLMIAAGTGQGTLKAIKSFYEV